MNDIAERLARRLFGGKLIGNQYRSSFVEEMIRPGLAAHGWSHTGDDWCGYDFKHGTDLRLEVKQSGRAADVVEAAEPPHDQPNLRHQDADKVLPQRGRHRA
jgi:hypothetical protein